MSLLDQLRDAQTEPARHRTSPFAGPSILTLAQLRAMERVLLREMPGYVPDTTVVLHEHHEPQVQQVQQVQHAPRVRRPDVELEPLALWAPPASVADATAPSSVERATTPPAPAPSPEVDAEALPVWSAPDAAPPTPTTPTPRSSSSGRREPDPCPQCGEAVSIGRIDLTANASWFSCRSCGLRWGGAIESSGSERDTAAAG